MSKNGKFLYLSTSMTFVLALAVGFFLWNQPEGQVQEAGSGSLKVGVVNVSKVFDQYQRADKFRKDIAKRKKEVEQRLNSISRELKKIEQELQDLEPQSDLWTDRATRYYKLRSESKVLRETWKQKVNKQVQEKTKAIFNEVQDVVQSFAKERNFDLILKVESPELPESQQANINQLINQRPVLYSRDHMDVTEEIVKRLKRNYQEEKDEQEDQ